MRVPARVFTDRGGIEAILSDRSLEQLVNAATLPGVEGYALAMPDIHQGYGFPVGGVVAIRTADGVISPGGIGYDINCGVRLLLSPFTSWELRKQIDALIGRMQSDIPSGVGRGGAFRLGRKEMDKVLRDGARWALRSGFASESDICAIEEQGQYLAADADCVSGEARDRGADQLGTLGSGNHFIEIQKVERVLNPGLADAFGIFPDQLGVMIHTGSRGLGHQVCTDYVRRMQQCADRYGISIPDRELACAPFHSQEGQEYFRAMAAAANFAWANRQLITHLVRDSWQSVLREPGAGSLRLLYDVSHNIAKLEQYAGIECVVHRKGATRAFGPGAPEVAERFRASGQPVIIPGSMGSASYVLAGTEAAMRCSFGSCAHGAGRRMSRMAARRSVDYPRLVAMLESRGIAVRAGSRSGLVEEAPEAYKDIDRVIDTVRQCGIAETVARLVPVGVIKG